MAQRVGLPVWRKSEDVELGVTCLRHPDEACSVGIGGTHQSSSCLGMQELRLGEVDDCTRCPCRLCSSCPSADAAPALEFNQSVLGREGPVRDCVLLLVSVEW